MSSVIHLLLLIILLYIFGSRRARASVRPVPIKIFSFPALLVDDILTMLNDGPDNHLEVRFPSTSVIYKVMFSIIFCISPLAFLSVSAFIFFAYESLYLSIADKNPDDASEVL
ncbi:hypothetical protein AUEXF2481DRAFT_5657 [Aureobasidium subglaciale EXF-2481]|uniref:CSC1/OSCA1-like 7TM region domain-containing protein n=1 Tax=Aureobasidium subglaciale (strain EXF-2481) TaxID=1043005 RepID=A0A074Z7B6_AURSE|nr:uncharacterized protein AUEXF2481DRAFT_5657 [Aureobasidium subglaciale EXF-2481]KEQ94776.1 hypothetical protein AUEXF2481DRAFT_5657 [Aureobasidium subglaciale EXF-2481]